jgi:serine protease AprX
MKAVLFLDPDRRTEQVAFVAERASILHEVGDRLWVTMPEELVNHFAEQGIQVQPHDDADLIELPAVLFDPEVAEPSPPPELTASEPAGDDTAYYLVQFAVAPEPSWVEQIEDLGGVFVEEVPIHAAVFKLTSTQAAAVRQLPPWISWIGLFHPAYALKFELAGRTEPFSAAELRNMRIDEEAAATKPEGALEVAFFADRDFQEMVTLVQSAGAVVVENRSFDIVINILPERIPQLLRIEGVKSVESHTAPTLENFRGGIISGANQIRNFGNVDFLINLDGSGETAGVFDTGLDATHTDFNVAPPGAASRVIGTNNLNPGATALDLAGHGTHVAGTIGGDGRNAPAPTPGTPNNSVPRGIAPACQLIATSVNNFPLPAPTPLTTNFGQFLPAFVAHRAAGARVHNNSWGSQAPNNYTNVSGILDAFCLLNYDAVVLFAAGNDEADLNNDGNFDQTFLGPRACAKNIIVVGATENVSNLEGDPRNYQTTALLCTRYGTLAASAVQIAANSPAAFTRSDGANDMAMFSSRGRVPNPANPARRRVKPDLVAPGTNILSVQSSVMAALGARIRQVCPPIANPPGIPNPQIPVTAPAGLYRTISGTSMATPNVSGCCLLVRQFYRQRFGQMRRPLLVEQIPSFVDLPAAAPHPSGVVLAWIRRDTAAAQNHLMAALFTRRLVRSTPIVQIATNVGDHPAIALATHGTNVVVLFRNSANNLQLLLRDAALAAVAGFGTAGTVTPATASRGEDNLRPTLAVRGDEIALAWVRAGATDNLIFQRFRADTGAAIDANVKVLGTARSTSMHPYLIHNGTRWAALFVGGTGGNFDLSLRFIDNNGNVDGAVASPASQNVAMREPHFAWDSRQNRFAIAFVSDAAAPANGLQMMLAGATGAGIGTTSTLIPRADTRRPRIAAHPDSGFALVWEDARESTHDVRLSLLDQNGLPAAVHETGISDTPNATGGFAAFVDNEGLVTAWQSNDEINSDLLGVYTVGVNKAGVFEAQADAATPLLVQQFYVSQKLFEHTDPTRVATAIAWGGGVYYFAQLRPRPIITDVHLVRTNADGRPDTLLAPDGAVQVDSSSGFGDVSLFWTGTQVVLVAASELDTAIYLLSPDGARVTTFAPTTSNDVTLAERPPVDIHPQVAQSGTGVNSRIFVAYGRLNAAAPHTIRYTVRTGTGAAAVAPRNLVQASGTAKHGWFHHVSTDTPVHFIAAWHVQVGANMVAQLNRFQINGAPQAGIPAPIQLTAMAGDAQNPVIAPRPIQPAPAFPVSAADNLNARRRIYGAAWQHRAAGGNWQIMFSRLQRNGRPSTVAGQFDQGVVQLADHATEPQLVWHTDGYGIAWLQQPTAGGNQQLFFTLLDENGARPNLAVAGAPAVNPINFSVSSASANVLRYQLIWTGRTFRISWTEVEGTQVRHMNRAIAVPRAAGGLRFDAPFQQPSAALVRATLINGATNMRNTALPNFGNNVNDGYGWGRVNLRQALAPAPPVTFHVRDDSVVGPGRTVRYEFPLPPETQLLRITLVWTDPPSNNLVNPLHLRVTTPAFPAGGVRVFHGNRFQTAAGSTHLSAPVVAPVPAFEGIHPIQQVVIAGPPALPAGNYIVEVIGGAFGASAYQQFPGQPFAIVFVGSGQELRTAAAGFGAPLPVY